MAQRITPSLARNIARLFAEGNTRVMIANRLGIDRHTVARHVANRDGEAAHATAAGDNSAAADATFLSALRRSLVRFVCNNCDHVSLRLPTMETGMCPSCGSTWVCVVKKRSAAAD